MSKKLTAKGIWKVLKNSFTGFSEDKVTKLSGSLAYYTVFSMGPLLVVIISLASIFLGREAIEGEIYRVLNDFIGSDTAATLQEVIRNASISGKGPMAAIIGGVTLLVGATTVFAEIQDSINSIWGLKAKPKTGWFKIIINRFLSFSVIASLGFILLVSLAITALIEGLNNRLQAAFPDVTVVVFYIINLLVTLIVITTIFMVIFKVLPDAKIRWRDVMAGSMVTAILFMIGKFAISFYISQTEVGSTYGAAGSLAILLIWVYYSSIILYFGAEFTKAYAVEFGREIHPNHYAVTVKQVAVETGKASVQEKEGQPAPAKAEVVEDERVPVQIIKPDPKQGGATA
jgi:membrane protein